MLSVHEVESFRRSQAMAPLSASHVEELLDTCEQLARQRAEIVRLLADLPESFTAVRDTLNRLHRIVQ